MRETIQTQSESTLPLAGRGKQALSPLWTGGISAKTLPNLTQSCWDSTELELTHLVSQQGSPARAQHCTDNSPWLPVQGWVMSGWLPIPTVQARVFLPPTAQPCSEPFAQLHKPQGPRTRERKLQPHRSAEQTTLHCHLGPGTESGLHPVSLKLFVSKLTQHVTHFPTHSLYLRACRPLVVKHCAKPHTNTE